MAVAVSRQVTFSDCASWDRQVFRSRNIPDIVVGAGRGEELIKMSKSGARVRTGDIIDEWQGVERGAAAGRIGGFLVMVRRGIGCEKK